MEPSEEIKQLVLQLYEKEAGGGLFEFASRLYSNRAEVFVLGSDPGDHYEGYESIRQFYKASSGSVLDISVDQIKAYSEDRFGWAVDQVTARLPDGVQVPVRHTYIFQHEQGGWRIVHAHISVAVPDESIRTHGLVSRS